MTVIIVEFADILGESTFIGFGGKVDSTRYPGLDRGCCIQGGGVHAEFSCRGAIEVLRHRADAKQVSSEPKARPVTLVGAEPWRGEDSPLPHHRAGSGPGLFRVEGH